MRVRRASAVALALALPLALTGCTSRTPDRTLEQRIHDTWQPVAVLRTRPDQNAGVHDHPLRAGQTLLFAFNGPVAPRWTMAGVEYPLELFGVDRAGNKGQVTRMEPCSGSVRTCPTYSSGYRAAYWVEQRPADD